MRFIAYCEIIFQRNIVTQVSIIKTVRNIFKTLLENKRKY